MASIYRNIVPSISVSSNNFLDRPSSNEHIHRRVFIGPMPDKVIFRTETNVLKQKKRGLFHSATAEDDVSQIIKDNAFSFFIHEGGRPEDWGETEEQSFTEEMLRRWKDSEWGAIWHRRRRQEESRPTNRWVGGSFEIGRLLGINLLQDSVDSIKRRTSSQSFRKASSLQLRTPMEDTLSMDHETFFTAPSHSTTTRPNTARSETNGAGTSDGEITTPGTSRTALIRPALGQIRSGDHESVKANTDMLPRPIINVPPLAAMSDGNTHSQGKGKGKLVHYADIPEQPAPGPAPPSEVLERTGSGVEETSAGATLTPNGFPIQESSEVFLRDRMLVRVSYTKSESISSQFDEVQNRTTSHLFHADWAEYMVAWRNDRIEIYEDYGFPGKEWVAGHKHLAYIIPVKSSKTRLSLYSFVDLTFCLTCPSATTHPKSSKSWWPFLGSKEGTNIFVFKLKSRSRAYDWTWQLWRQLGGQIPRNIEIRNPRMNTTVKIDIPATINIEEVYHVFSRENLIALCMNSLSSVPDWKNVIERNLMEGKTFELAWRVDTNLDWIWLEDDIYGMPRQSAVLCGLALRQSTRPAVLEVRLAEHYPTHIHLRNGDRLHEPPAIEGYLDRVRPNTQTKQSMYLTTHDGNLFVLSSNRAHPPSPPGLAPATGDLDSLGKLLRKTETQRGAMQVIDATGVNDLRTILLIRRAFQITPQPTHEEAHKAQDDDILFGIWSHTEDKTQSDDEDEGGEEGLGKRDDKARLRMRRSFELLLTTGHVVRFEAYSCRVAIEWIERLRALVLYWKQRHRIDAREEMDLAQARRPRLTPQTRAFQDASKLPPEPPEDSSAQLPALGSMYNWCVLQVCKSIIRGGKVYMRRGLYGQYQLVQMFLVAGHLVHFRIAPQTSLHPSIRKKTNLMDAYVCSGYFAALALPKGQYDPSTNIAPRRYQDGLEADDPEEDMLFMVWYHPQAPMIESPTEGAASAFVNPPTIPTLSAKRKLLVFRTRSKLERDAWCWALNCEIEKIVRTQKEREEKLRETGSLSKL